MPRITPSTERRRASGQALVVLAAAIAVLAGIVALGIDAGRAYVDRRQLQAGVDAAALAAADRYHREHDLGAAFGQGEKLFAENVYLYGEAGGGGGTYTWPAYTLELATSTPPHGGTVFQATAHHALPLTMMRVLGVGPTADIAAEAWAIVDGPSQTPALLTLSQAGCPRVNGNSLTVQGNPEVTIQGDVYSNGTIAVNAHPPDITVSGDVFAHCGDIPSQVVAEGEKTTSAPPMEDAGFPPSYALPAYATPQGTPGSTVELRPGVYAGDPGLGGGSGCYFLAAGIYTWQGGYKSNGGLVSNELRPPGEPGTPLWNGNGVNCGGSVRARADGSGQSLTAGTWGVVVTSTRQDVFYDAGRNPLTASRESAPSACVAVAVQAGQGLQVAVSNVPGAQAYNVYVSSGGCGGGFGYLASVATGPMSNASTRNCPYVPAPPWTPGPQAAPDCSLGFTVTPLIGRYDRQVADGSRCAVSPGPWEPASAGERGCAPPDPQLDPPGPRPLPAPPAGDRANEFQCLTWAGTPTACPSDVTPGGVQFNLPGGACLDQQGQGATNVFSGAQYGWIVIYQPDRCQTGDNLTGGAFTRYLGTVYAPTSELTLNGSSASPLYGEVICYTAKINGTGGVAIIYDAFFTPPPPGARLVR